MSWEPLDEFEEAWIHPREFYMTSEDRFKQALEDIEGELGDGWTGSSLKIGVLRPID